MTFIKGDNVKYKWNGTKTNHNKDFLTDVIYYQNGYRGEGGVFHPQALPIDLTEEMIRLFTNEGDLVIDPFMGSGTTAVVCEKLNRRWVGVEIKNKYCNMIVDRIKKTGNQLKLF